jgi:sec-independent protein translocase protein TatC
MTTTDRSPGMEDARSDGGEMTLFGHLAELRDRLFKSVAALGVGMLVGFGLHRPMLEILTQPYCELPPELRAAATGMGPEACNLIVTDVLGHFFLVIKVSAVIALVLAGPVAVYQIWRFVTPGLRPVERRYAFPFVLASALLFLGGAAFSYFILPRALQVLLGFAGPSVVSLLEANQYLGFLLHMMIGFGIAFQMPLVLTALILTGTVTSRGLRQYRRHALFGTFVAAAIITPTTDPLTMSLMAGPLVVFYELATLFARLRERRRRRRGAAAGTA